VLTPRYFLPSAGDEEREELLGAADPPRGHGHRDSLQLLHELRGLRALRINRLGHQRRDPEHRQGVQRHFRGDDPPGHHLLPGDDFLVPLEEHFPPGLPSPYIFRDVLLEAKSAGS